MRISSIRPVAAATLALFSLASAGSASARTIKHTTAVTKADGVKVVDHTTYDTKTDAYTAKVKTTRPDGEFRTVSVKSTPAATGGFTVSRSVTGFDGQTHTSTNHVGGRKA